MKKSLPKLLCLLLILAMAVSFAGCGNGENAADDPAAKAVAAYVEEHKSELNSGIAESFAQSSGMECESKIYADGTKIVIDLNVIGLNDVPADQKELMQEAYDSLSETFDGMVSDMQKEIPEVTGLVINVCEEDGDLLAKVEGKA